MQQMLARAYIHVGAILTLIRSSLSSAPNFEFTSEYIYDIVSTVLLLNILGHYLLLIITEFLSLSAANGLCRPL